MPDLEDDLDPNAVDQADDAGDAGDDQADDAGDTDDGASATSTEGSVVSKRGETRYQKLANDARAASDRAIRAEARAEALEQMRSAPVDNSAAARARAEKLALMDPTERALFETQETVRRLEHGQQLIQIQTADQNDKAAYERKAVTNPVYAKHADWVENALMAARQKGNNPSRDALLRWKIGEDALSAKPSKAAKVAKEAAATRVQTSKGATVSARGDVSAKKGGDDSVAALKARILAREASGDTY